MWGRVGSSDLSDEWMDGSLADRISLAILVSDQRLLRQVVPSAMLWAGQLYGDGAMVEPSAFGYVRGDAMPKGRTRSISVLRMCGSAPDGHFSLGEHSASQPRMQFGTRKIAICFRVASCDRPSFCTQFERKPSKRERLTAHFLGCRSTAECAERVF